MVELEQQIAAWVDAETEGVDPVTTEEVLRRAVEPALDVTSGPHGGRRATTLAGIAVAAVVLVVAGLATMAHRDGRAEVVRSSEPAPTVPQGWETLTVPTLGWTVTAPFAWSSSIWDQHCDGTNGVLVVNGPVPIGRATDPEGCNSEWDAAGRDRSDLVALAIVDDPRVSGSGPAPGPDTRLPLAIDDLGAHDRADGEPLVRTIGVVRNGDPSQHLEVWIGDDAPADDLATLQRILTSLAWTGATTPRPTEPGAFRGHDVGQATGSPRMTTFLVCLADEGFHPFLTGPASGMIDGVRGAVVTWPDGEQDRPGYEASYQRCNEQAGDTVRLQSLHGGPWRERPGISQSAVAAERDGTAPVVADLTMAERATTTHWFEAPEGTWAITTMPEPPKGPDCVPSDPDHEGSADVVCRSEYGEVLLVDRSGAIERAYPMPGVAPTWIYATEDAVYAGHVGRGSQPESTIARIDRTTLQAEVLVFGAEDGVLEAAPQNWSAAPMSADVTALVRVGDDSGTLVDSTVGVTSVDLPAIEQLFA